MKNLRIIVTLLAMLLCIGCQSAPKIGYVDLPNVVIKRQELKDMLLALLPAEQKNLTAAQEEATWLADTAFKSAAAIARYNDPVFVNWLNNRAVNTRNHYRHRGLCWHYQHDLYRELRRRPLQYFRLGCCVRDQGKGGEHHVVYVAHKQGKWPSIVMLDAWWYAGRLVVEDESEAKPWVDDTGSTAKLNKIYPEAHKKPLEHWAMVRRSTRYADYVDSDDPTARNTPQWLYMQEQMKKGLQQRNGKPIDY